jgi:hypothetical protein
MTGFVTLGQSDKPLFDFRVMAAVITNANLPAVEMAARIIRALSDLARIVNDRERPFLYALHQNRIEDIPDYGERISTDLVLDVLSIHSRELSPRAAATERKSSKTCSGRTCGSDTLAPFRRTP